MAADRLHRLMATLLKRAVRSWKAGRTPAATREADAYEPFALETLNFHRYQFLSGASSGWRTKFNWAHGIHAKTLKPWRQFQYQRPWPSSRGVTVSMRTVSPGLRATCQLHAELTTTIDSVLDGYHDEMRHRMTDSDDVVVFQPTTDQPFSFHIPTERIEDTVPLVASIFYKSQTTLVSSCSTKSPTGPKTTTLSSGRPQIRHQIRLSQT